MPVTDEYFCYVLDVNDKLNLGESRTTINGDETIVSFPDEYDLL